MKSALLALVMMATPIQARQLLSEAASRRQLLSDSDSTILADITDLPAMNTWIDTYLKTDGGLQTVFNDIGEKRFLVGKDYIDDGGNDLYDEGNELVLKMGGSTWTDPVLYTQNMGPLRGTLVTETSNGIDYTYTTLIQGCVFSFIAKPTNANEEFRAFAFQGEMGSSADVFYKGQGSVSFNSATYGYYWVMRLNDGTDGKFDLIVLNNAAGKHCVGEKCAGSDYDYHRVYDKEGFTQVCAINVFIAGPSRAAAGSTAATLTNDFDTNTAWIEDVVKRMAAAMTNVL